MKTIKSKTIVLKRADIDTDLIIPAEFLTVTDKKGLGKHVFARLRAMDEQFPFNLAENQGRSVLIAGANFGCGSSREHAAWALADWGIRVIIAPSFADIFKNNAFKNGILVVEMEIIVDEVEVDLPAQTINGRHFEIDPYRKECLIKGIDDLDYLFENRQKIADFDRQRAEKLFFNISKI